MLCPLCDKGFPSGVSPLPARARSLLAHLSDVHDRSQPNGCTWLDNSRGEVLKEETRGTRATDGETLEEESEHETAVGYTDTSVIPCVRIQQWCINVCALSHQILKNIGKNDFLQDYTAHIGKVSLWISLFDHLFPLFASCQKGYQLLAIIHTPTSIHKVSVQMYYLPAYPLI